MKLFRYVVAVALLLAPAVASAQSNPCVTATGQQIVPCTATVPIDGAGRALTAGARSISGMLSAPGTDGKTIELRGRFNFSIAASGMSNVTNVDDASILVERSFDGGATWFTARAIKIGTAQDGDPIVGVDGMDPTLNSLSTTWDEPEAGVRYRMRAERLPLGSITYRISQ